MLFIKRPILDDDDSLLIKSFASYLLDVTELIRLLNNPNPLQNRFYGF